MEEKIQVQMTENMLYDLMLFHTYSKLAGFLTNVLGMAVIFMGIIMFAMGKNTAWQLVFYIVAGIAFLGFTPLQLKLRARKQLKINPEYREVCTYLFGESGITAIRDEKTKVYEWDSIQRVVATPKTIGYYYDENRAIIIPKQAYGKRFTAVMNIVLEHVPRGMVKIR